MNNFEFDNNYYIQLHGTAMSAPMASGYANLFPGEEVTFSVSTQTVHLVAVHR